MGAHCPLKMNPIIFAHHASSLYCHHQATIAKVRMQCRFSSSATLKPKSEVWTQNTVHPNWPIPASLLSPVLLPRGYTYSILINPFIVPLSEQIFVDVPPPRQATCCTIVQIRLSNKQGLPHFTCLATVMVGL